MARFAISGDHLYTVDGNYLTVVSLARPDNPVVNDKRYWIGSNIETIFPMDTLLFIGSQNGLYIYNIKDPETPKQLSHKLHVTSCDPVVAAGNLAFVTLNSSLGNWCGQTTTNVLQAYDVSDLEKPELICSVDLSSPRGLAVDMERKLVFVCDNGIKAYDITDPKNIVSKYDAADLPEVGKIDAYDCIVSNEGRLLVIGAAGLYQLGYDRDKFTFISKIDTRD